MLSLLLIVYLLLCSAVIFWLNRRLPAPFSFPEVLFLLALKVFAGYFLYRYQTEALWINDYNYNNLVGTQDYGFLKHNLPEYFNEFLRNNRSGYGNFFESRQSFWNDVGDRVLFKILGPLNFLTHGNYLLNSIFINALSLGGLILFYQTALHTLKGNKALAMVVSFFIPSTLLYGSGIHKDPLILALLGSFCYALYFGLRSGFSKGKIIALIASWLLILLIRNYTAVILAPFAVTFFVSEKFRIRPAKAYGLLMVLAFSAYLLLGWLSPAKNIDTVLASKQLSYFDLGRANTQVPLDTLKGNAVSTLSTLPQAFKNVLLQPVPYHNLDSEMLPFAFETLFILVTLFFGIYAGIKSPSSGGFTLCCFFFALCCLVITGLTVPNLGAIFRYRSVYLPFLLLPFFRSIDNYINIKNI